MHLFLSFYCSYVGTILKSPALNFQANFWQPMVLTKNNKKQVGHPCCYKSLFQMVLLYIPIE